MKKTLCLIVSLAILGISGCDVFLGPDAPVGIGTLSIGFGEDGGNRSAFDVSEDILATLRYDLVLTGPNKQKISASLAVGQTFNGQVALGEWLIEAKAFTPEETLFGTGSTTITVRAGTNHVRVPMTKVATEDMPVSALDLTALVAAPVRDTTPNTTAIDEAQYTGTIAWQKGDGTSFTGNFAPSTIYQAVISLTATAGYTFAGVGADSFSHAGALSIINAAGSGNAITVTISFPVTAAPGEDTVSALDLTALVIAPVKGAAPDTTPISAVQYTGTISWEPADSLFAPSTVYTATVSLTATAGYTFAGLRAGSFSHDGATTVTNPAGGGTAMTVTISFPETAANGVSAFDLTALVIAPVKGAAPDTTPISDAQYTGTISWQKANGDSFSGNFAPSTVYQAVISLTAATGYTFDGVGAGSFDHTHTGTTVTNPAGSGNTITVTISFPETAAPQNTITLSPDAGDGTFSQASFTVSKSGGTGSQTVTLDPDYANPRWIVDGDLKGTGMSIAINAADYGLGDHLLTLLAVKNGISWSKEIAFTVESGTLRTVIFRPNDGTGTIYAIRTVAAGSVIDGFPGDPARAEYDFSGWNTQPGGGGSAFDDATTVSTDTTVYAQWTGKTYTVTFMQNYSQTDTTSAGSASVVVPATTVAPADFPAPARPSYNLAGWNTQWDGSGAAFGLTTEVHGDTTVYAQWAHENFNITLNLDAGDGAFSQGTFAINKGGEPGSQTVSIDGSGYANPRWIVDGDLKGTGTGITINAADYSLGEHNLTLLINKSGVSWSREITFTVNAGTLQTVIFRPEDGTGTIYAVRTATTGSVIDGFPGDPARDDYDFSGWYTQPGGGGSAFDDATTVSADTTVYAHWTGKTYTVTFMQNHDTSDSVIMGTAAVNVPPKTVAPADFPALTTRPSYNFAGWNTQRDGSGAAFGVTTEVHGDSTVYAQWAPENFIITLNPDAGSGAFNQGNFSLSKSGAGSQPVALTGAGYANPRWIVDGDLKGTGTAITINAADYSLGEHNLTLLISKSGVSWSKELTFTVN